VGLKVVAKEPILRLKCFEDGPMVKAETKYPNPPIQETICEVHFDLGQPLSLQRIELLKEMWAAEYPEQKVVQERSVNGYET